MVDVGCGEEAHRPTGAEEAPDSSRIGRGRAATPSYGWSISSSAIVSAVRWYSFVVFGDACGSTSPPASPAADARRLIIARTARRVNSGAFAAPTPGA